jgi:hypothetical protein
MAARGARAAASDAGDRVFVFRITGPTFVDLIAGQVQISFASTPSSEGQR